MRTFERIMLIVLSCLVIGLACKKTDITNNNDGGGGNNGCDFIEFTGEDNDSLANARFISNLTPPDHYFVCGATNAVNDADCYQFFTPADEYVSIVVNTINTSVPMELSLFNHDEVTDVYTLLGHFYGDPGQLVILNWPTDVINDGFFIRVSCPVHAITDYRIELWTTGFIQ